MKINKRPGQIRRAIGRIKPRGGGDCREFSLRGLKLALKKSKPDSVICLFTDAAPKDTKLLPDVVKLIKEKRSKVNSGMPNYRYSLGEAEVHVRH